MHPQVYTQGSSDRILKIEVNKQKVELDGGVQGETVVARRPGEPPAKTVMVLLVVHGM